MLCGDALHNLHGQLVVVHGYICGAVYRRRFVLRGRRFVVSGLCGDAQLPKLFVQVPHIFGYYRIDGSEIMVFQVLTFRRTCAEQSPARKTQILSGGKIFFGNQKIFLFGSDRGIDVLYVFFPDSFQQA